MSGIIENNHKYTCALCHKQYTRKLSLDKHKILCEFKLKTKTENKIEELFILLRKISKKI